MASFFSISPSSSLMSRTPHFSPLRFGSSAPQFKNHWVREVMVLRVKCSLRPNRDTELEAEQSSFSSSSISTYSWCAGLGSLGFLETAYLTYLKLSNTDAFCPIGGGNCGDILNSDYALVFGVPLPLIGMAAYGLVATLGLQMTRKDLPFKISEITGRFILLGSTTAMAVSSAYFLYILSTKFEGASCLYCLTSALLSFGLLFTIVKDFGLQEIQRVVGLQLCIASLVVATLSTSYNISPSASTSLAEIDLQPFTTEITTQSSPLAISLARHLHSIGAKMYGAFWCSHCIEQKQIFGREASKLLDYVECFPEGYRKGVKIAKACADARIEGFPTWVINGEVLSGDKELSELAQVSGFDLDGFSQPN